MSSFHALYTCLWVLLCCVAVFFWIARLEAVFFFQRDYWQFLLRPWKIASFMGVALFMVLIAPYSGDFTWDYVDGLFMSLLTYITAPWSVGIFFRFINGHATFRQVFLALCLWGFSASWSYDIYLYFRDGHYPVTWLANLGASSILYWCAGLFWSLDWRPDMGVYYSFKQKIWFDYYHGPVFWNILRKGWVFVLVAGIILGGVVVLLNIY